MTTPSSKHVFNVKNPKKLGFRFLLDYYWTIGLNWIFSVQSNPIIQQKSKNPALELDLVGCSIIHQNRLFLFFTEIQKSKRNFEYFSLKSLRF
jgi:hypothetical protein